MRASRSSRRSVHSRTAPRTSGADPARVDAERAVARELDAWRTRAVPDASAPLDTDDLVRLLRDFVATLALDRNIVADLSANTVHYYRRKDIIDPPTGRTTAARYGLRHLWQVAGARMAGYLGLVTLAEARDAMRGADEPALVAFVAARVTDARSRALLRSVEPESPTIAARPLAGRANRARPNSQRAITITLPGDVLCIVPESHEALQSADAARELARSLVIALGGESSTG